MTSYPLIIDTNDDVLSFPPIINGEHTTVTHTTRDFFVDVTGWDERACEAALLLVCLQLIQWVEPFKALKSRLRGGPHRRTVPNGENARCPRRTGGEPAWEDVYR